MKIPIENIYYLLCYAWNKLQERDLIKIVPTESTELADLFAKVLISGINHLIRRGFDRGYIPCQEPTQRIRGRECFAPTIKRDLLRHCMVECEFDELSYNVLHNRILKSTIKNLKKARELDSALQDQLTVCCHRLGEVEEIELSNRLFGKVQLHRNNSFYDFLMRVCELLYSNLLPTEKGGVWHFKDFLQDENKMPYVFEEFVRNFYKIEADGFRVGRENISWGLISANEIDKGLLPEMQTDISLRGQGRKIIIECKYMSGIEPNRFGTPKLRASHLAQIMAYLTNLANEPLNRSCRAILLYPTTSQAGSHTYHDSSGRKITVTTINLDQCWQGIHKDLLAMIA